MSFNSVVVSVIVLVVSFFATGCDMSGGEYYNGYDATIDVRFADVGVGYDVSHDALLYQQVRGEYEGDPADPPFDPDFSQWQGLEQLCKVDSDCADDGDVITDLIGCDTQSHRCVHTPPEGCYTIRTSGEVYGDPDNFQGVFPDPDVEMWPSCPSGNCHHFSYCPILGQYDYFNIKNVVTGNWAADWDSCPNGVIDDSVFIDVLPKQVGCRSLCFASSTYDPPFKELAQWQCSADYL